MHALAKAALSLAVAATLAASAAWAQEADYVAGQAWEYRTAPGDEGSLVYIREVDRIGPDEEPMTVYHVTMTGILIPGVEEPLEIGHLPVSRETLDASVVRLVESDAQLPDYLEGKTAWANANGGVFTISLAEIATFLRDQIGTHLRHGDRQ